MSTLHSMNNYIFLYNALSHLSLSISKSLTDPNKKQTLLFSLGHLFIATAQMSFFGETFTPGTGKVSMITGTIGHTCLLFFILRKMMTSVFSSWNIIFLLGQLGMIYFYLNHIDEKKEISILFTNKELKHAHIFLITFIAMFIYYLKSFYSASHRLVSVSLLLVAGVYLSFIYHFTMALMK